MHGQLTRFLFRFISLFLLVVFTSSHIASVKASSGPAYPQTPPQPVWAPEALAPSTSLASAIGTSALTGIPPLKAVIFVGPIDDSGGVTGSWTLSRIQGAQDTAAAMRAKGVEVHEFYPNQPNGTWENIKNAANGAHFLIYHGHGVSWGGGSTPIVGGFSLKDTFVSNDMIRAELRPAKNFIMMIYGCFSAGSAGNDSAAISQEEARRRVEMYSDPFFDIGAGGYYADWFAEAFTSYAVALLEGKTQQQAYEGYQDYHKDRMWRGSHRDHPALALWLGWDNWYEPKPNWNNAFAGNPENTLADLFAPTTMLLSTNEVVAMAQPDSPKRTYQVTIRSNTSTSFPWAASVVSPPAWLTALTPSEGVTDQALTLEVDPSLGGEAGGSVTIRVATSQADVNQPQQDILVKLTIVPEMKMIYLPSVRR